MNRLFTEYKIDYIIHGDDPCLLPDGTDAYALAKKVGRYKQIKRTEGVSSTDIVGTITLLCYVMKLKSSNVSLVRFFMEDISCSLRLCLEYCLWNLMYECDVHVCLCMNMMFKFGPFWGNLLCLMLEFLRYYCKISMILYGNLFLFV